MLYRPPFSFTLQRGGVGMTKKQFDRERDYGAVMSIARAMLKQGCITDKEYNKIDTIFLRKYKPIIGLLRAKSA